MGSPDSQGAIIPPEWVAPRTPPPSAAAPARIGAPIDAEPPRSILNISGSVVASLDSAVSELVAPVDPPMHRGRCFVEPGKTCTGSGRCRQRGY